MKKTALTIAAVLGMSALSAPAFAQASDKPLINGSEATENAVEQENRESVQQGTPAETMAPADAETSAAPVNENEIKLDEAKTRESVAAGTDAETTTPSGTTDAPKVDGATGNENEIKLKEADERKAVAAGTKAETTGPDGSTTAPAAQ